jgi:hypothetical protein
MNGSNVKRATWAFARVRSAAVFFAFASLVTKHAGATTTVSICQETEDVIVHPATYVQQKVKRGGISCFLLPHCCTPAWVLDPVCYAFTWIQDKNAWDEVVKTITCEDYSLSPEEAFAQWLQNFTDPVPGFTIVPSEVGTAFGTYVSTAMDAASPLPDDVKKTLKYLVQHADAPFSTANIEQARYLSASHVLAKPLWPGESGGRYAITYYNLIIVKPDFFTADHCTQVWRFAHELVHVHQYNVLGWQPFLEKYLLEGMKGYENNSFEEEARAYEGAAAAGCFRSKISVTVGGVSQTPVVGTEAKQKAFSSAIAEQARKGAITLEKGAITKISPDALSILRKDFPTLEAPKKPTRAVLVSRKDQPPSARPRKVGGTEPTVPAGSAKPDASAGTVTPSASVHVGPTPGAGARGGSGCGCSVLPLTPISDLAMLLPTLLLVGRRRGRPRPD